MIDTHIFAFYTELPAQSSIGLLCVSFDQLVLHRIAHVVKLQEDDPVIFFNGTLVVQATIKAITKKHFSYMILGVEKTVAQAPCLTLVLPVLKRDALEAALYSAGEMGVNVIQLVVTEKSGRTVTDKEYARAQLILIAAAEQAKQYCLPTLKKIVPYGHYVQEAGNNKEQEIKIVCDGSGVSLIQHLSLYKKPEQPVSIVVGPEGGLTQQEVQLAKLQGYVPCKLTNTTLRAMQAVAVSIGIIRSFD
jgi:16S rRNA (uracil1498-N3)-methyltransferase